MSYDVFLSYSRKDMAFADEVYRHLNQNCGYSVFLDREAIEVGSDWGKELVEAVKTSNIFLLILSEYSVASENVDKEICLAINNKKPIVPLRIQNIPMTGAKEYQLATIQIIDIFDKTLEEQLAIIQKSIETKLGAREAAKSDDAHFLVKGISDINAKFAERLGKMGTSIYCRFDHANLINVWLPFSVGPFGASANIHYNGKSFIGTMNLNGQHCTVLKCIYQFLDKHFPPAPAPNEFSLNVKNTRQKCNDIFHFFSYPATCTTIAPRPTKEAVVDILRLSEAFFGKFIEAVGDYVEYAKKFRNLLSETDKEVEAIFPETEGWKIESKLSSFNGLTIRHRDSLATDKWLGFRNLSDPESLLSIKIFGDNYAYNNTKIAISKISADVLLGIEDDIYNSCKTVIGEGNKINQFLFYQQIHQPLNHPGIITWQWQARTEEELQQFKKWILDKLAAVKPVYLDALVKLNSSNPLELAKSNSSLEEKTWNPKELRYFLAQLLQKKIIPILSPNSGWVPASTLDWRGATAILSKAIGKVELRIELLCNINSMSVSIALKHDNNPHHFAKLLNKVLSETPHEGLNILPASGFLSETVKHEKPFSDRGLTLHSWLGECEAFFISRLPILIEMANTAEKHLQTAVKIAQSLSEKLSNIFSLNEWSILNDVKNIVPKSGIRVFKKSWVANTAGDVSYLEFKLEYDGLALNSMYFGITGYGYTSLSPILKEILLGLFREEFSRDHKVEWNECWIRVNLKDDYRNPGFPDGENRLSGKEEEFIEYVKNLFERIKRLTPAIDSCVKELKKTS